MTEIRDRLIRAIRLQQAGRIAEAEGLYAEILAVHPGHADALHLKGVAASQSGRLEEAAGLIRRAIAVSGSVADFHHNLAKVLAGLGDWVGAAERFRSAVALDPRRDPVWAELGVALSNADRPADAAAAFGRGLAVTPQDPRLLYWRATALADSGALEEAERCFAALAGLPPESVRDVEDLAGVARMVRLSDAFFAGLDPQPAGPAPSPADLAPGDGPVLLVCGDSRYVHLFIRPVVTSILRHAGPGYGVHVHVIDPDDAVASALAALRTAYPKLALGTTTESTATADRSANHRKTYYACGRFLQLPRLLAAYGRPILALDLDQLVLKPLQPVFAHMGACDVGLFRVAANRLDFSSSILANLVLAGTGPPAARFFGLVAAYLRHFRQTSEGFGWYLDQVALHAVCCHMRRGDPGLAVSTFPDSVVNTEIRGEPAPDAGDPESAVFWNLYHSVSGTDSKRASETFRRYTEFG